MSIAISTYAPGTIATYRDLVAELRDLLDDADYDNLAIDRAIRKAEAQFTRELRVPEMEPRVVLVVNGPTVALPLDFRAVRLIRTLSTPPVLLQGVSPAALSDYIGQTGSPLAYAIEGKALRIAPVSNVTVELLYYAAIPSLSDNAVSNWLLQRHPDLYVSGAMYYLAWRERDSDGMAQAAQMTQTLLASINGEGQRNRWGGIPLVPKGMGQVSGVRA